MEEKKLLIKRFLHNNAVTVATVLIFLIILAILLLSRFGSLMSIANIANINPLITTESAKLVAVNVNGVIKIIKDDDGKVTEAEKKAAANDKGSTTNKSNQGGGSTSGSSSGGSSGGGSGSGGSSGGSGSGGGTPSPSISPSSSPSPSPSNSTPPQTTPLSATVSLRYNGRAVKDRVWLALFGWSCKNDHSFKATVTATGGSGPAKIRWKHGNTVKVTNSLGAMSNGDIKTADYTLTGQSVSGTMFVEILNNKDDVIASDKVDFSHSC